MMKPSTFVRLFIAVLCAPFCLASARSETPARAKVDAAHAKVDAAHAKVETAPSHTPSYVSAFNDNRTFGKDPFFPRSTRRQPTLTVNTNSVPITGELPGGMVLKGLSGIAPKRLAVINNYTFAEGEEAEIRVGHQLFRVRCVEIKERAVMISVNGSAPRELALRQGL